MTLTEERAAILSELLTADTERGSILLTLEPAEALAQINALGNDFTLEEINEYGEVMKAVLESQGELDDDALDNVAGGAVPVAVAAAPALTWGIVAGASAIAAGAGAVAGAISRYNIW
ncbi:MAG: class IIb bacteriocin, lactobin A/cerein 7B family [Peptococcaceae bacterium]|nr:class IIb bacteriocin, lactobin A/cerein 7B family [Peptococcaceae bacterium]